MLMCRCADAMKQLFNNVCAHVDVFEMNDFAKSRKVYDVHFVGFPISSSVAAIGHFGKVRVDFVIADRHFVKAVANSGTSF